MLRFKFAADITRQGQLGWRDNRIPFGSPFNALVEPYGLAHDCLDHFALTSLSDEIEANGAMYYSRFEDKYWQLGFPLESIANLRGLGFQWHNMARALEEHNLPPAPIIHEIRLDIIDEIIQEAFVQLKDAASANWEYKANKIAEVYRGWFTIGFLKAKARWGAWEYAKHDIINLFTRLIEALKGNEPTSIDESMEVVIRRSGEILILRNAGELDQEWQMHK